MLDSGQELKHGFVRCGTSREMSCQPCQGALKVQQFYSQMLFFH